MVKKNFSSIKKFKNEYIQKIALSLYRIIRHFYFNKVREPDGAYLILSKSHKSFEEVPKIFIEKVKAWSKKREINPKVVNVITPSRLKKCGLSRQKVRGIKELAKKFVNKTFNPRVIKKMGDEEAILYLSELRQIGRWSAEMILLFTYNRSNIWPVQDIGLLRAISNNYSKSYLPPMSYVNRLKKRFSPYCSVATWYLWRSIDDEPIQY